MANLELFRNVRTDAKITASPQYVILLRPCILDGQGNALLTTRCAGLSELDAEIDATKAKLDDIKKKAHAQWEDRDKELPLV